MRDILIFIGDWPQHSIEELGLFKDIEKKFDSRIKKIDDFAYDLYINQNHIRFQFCFGPNDDFVWEERRKARETPENRMPLSIERLHKLGVNASEVYYFGFCGVFHERPNSTFLPTSFKKILFNDYPIDENSFKRAKILFSKKFNNHFIGLINGKKCKALTSNHVLFPRYFKDKSLELLKKVSLELSKISDIVEMEGYELLSLYGSKFKGAFYIGSDKPIIIGAKRLPNQKTFRKKFLYCSIKILEKIIK